MATSRQPSSTSACAWLSRPPGVVGTKSAEQQQQGKRRRGRRVGQWARLQSGTGGTHRPPRALPCGTCPQRRPFGSPPGTPLPACAAARQSASAAPPSRSPRRRPSRRRCLPRTARGARRPASAAGAPPGARHRPAVAGRQSHQQARNGARLVTSRTDSRIAIQPTALRLFASACLPQEPSPLHARGRPTWMRAHASSLSGGDRFSSAS